MSKYSVVPVVQDHLKTLRDVRTHHTRWPDVLVLYGLPVAITTLSVLRHFRVQGIGDVVGGLSILAGFLFALVIWVFQLRLSVTSDPRVSEGDLLPRLIDELFANVSYAVLVGLAVAGVAIAAASTRTTDKSGALDPLNHWWTGLLVFLFVHLLLLLSMTLQRTRVAYREMRR